MQLEDEAVVTARTRYGSAKVRECGELLYSSRFPLMLKSAVHKSYVRPAIQRGHEAWCLKEIFTKDRKIHGESNVWSTAPRQKNIYRFDVNVGSELELSLKCLNLGLKP